MSLLGDIFKDVDLGLMMDMIADGPGGSASSWDSFDFFSIGQNIHNEMFFDLAQDIMGQNIPLDDRLMELGSVSGSGSVTLEDGAVTWSVPVPGTWGSEYFYSVTGIGVIEGIRPEAIPPLPEYDGTLLIA